MKSIITTALYFLSIFIPLTFTITNSELFEFPKFILLLSGALVILVAWGLELYKTRNLQLKGLSPISFAVLAILATQTLSTLFSIHPYTSFWGYYSRFHGGLLTTICYTIIYFAALRFLDKKTTLNIIKISVGTSFLIGTYAILEHFGIDKNFWIQDVQNRVFSTLGQPNWLAAYLIPNLFLVLYLLGISKNISTNPFLLLIYLTLFSALLFTKSRSGFIAFGLSYLTYWYLLDRQFSLPSIRQNFMIFSLATLLSVALIGSPYSPKILNLINNSTKTENVAKPTGTVLDSGGTESGDIRKIVWTGAIELIKKYPILGTGPETFAYTYYWTRPIAHNQTSEWDFLYNKAHNEYLNLAANTGLVGLVAYLFFHLTIFITGFTIVPKTKKISDHLEDSRRHLYPVLAAAIVGFTITNFFGFSVIPVYFLMIMIVILPTTIGQDQVHTPTDSSPLAYILALIVLIYPASIFLADHAFARGKKLLDSGRAIDALPYLKKAASYRPNLDLFQATLGEAYAATGQKDLALASLDRNKKLNAYHLNFYKSRAKIYLTLTTIDPKYHVQAARELEQARELAPTDPKLAYNLGLVYTRLSEVVLSEKNLRDAISLKPNYPEPYYALTLLYEETKQTTKIAPLLTEAVNNLATSSAQLKEKIDKYTNQ